MKKSRLNVEKAIRTLREVEVLQGQGMTISESCRKIGGRSTPLNPQNYKCFIFNRQAGITAEGRGLILASLNGRCAAL